MKKVIIEEKGIEISNQREKSDKNSKISSLKSRLFIKVLKVAYMSMISILISESIMLFMYDSKEKDNKIIDEINLKEVNVLNEFMFNPEKGISQIIQDKIDEIKNLNK